MMVSLILLILLTTSTLNTCEGNSTSLTNNSTPNSPENSRFFTLPSAIRGVASIASAVHKTVTDRNKPSSSSSSSAGRPSSSSVSVNPTDIIIKVPERFKPIAAAIEKLIEGASSSSSSSSSSTSRPGGNYDFTSSATSFSPTNFGSSPYRPSNNNYDRPYTSGYPTSGYSNRPVTSTYRPGSSSDYRPNNNFNNRPGNQPSYQSGNRPSSGSYGSNSNNEYDHDTDHSSDSMASSSSSSHRPSSSGHRPDSWTSSTSSDYRPTSSNGYGSSSNGYGGSSSSGYGSSNSNSQSGGGYRPGSSNLDNDYNRPNRPGSAGTDYRPIGGSDYRPSGSSSSSIFPSGSSSSSESPYRPGSSSSGGYRPSGSNNLESSNSQSGGSSSSGGGGGSIISSVISGLFGGSGVSSTTENSNTGTDYDFSSGNSRPRPVRPSTSFGSSATGSRPSTSHINRPSSNNNNDNYDNRPSSSSSSTSVTGPNKATFAEFYPEKCGTDFVTKIVGGEEADPNRWKWMSGLLKKGTAKSFCGGALITNRHVLTAAHCLTSISIDQLTVRIGEYDYADSVQDGIDYQVLNIKLHARYDKSSHENDIAIVTLRNPVNFDGELHPICLPARGSDYSGKMSKVIGWGVQSSGSRQPTTRLREVSFPIWPKRDCDSVFGSRTTGRSMICAGVKEGGKDSCQGDSGGPLMVKQSDRWVISGIVSWGIKCGSPGYPGVYTKVSDYIDWIKQNVPPESQGRNE